jgi:hypothetical protein
MIAPVFVSCFLIPRVHELSHEDSPLAYHPFDPHLDEDLLAYVCGNHSLELIHHLPSRRNLDVRRRGRLLKPHPSLPGWLLIFKKLRYARPSWLICPPLHVRWDIIAMFHDTLGHSGISQTLYALHKHYHWPGIKEDVVLFVKTCEPCQRMKITAPPDEDPEIPVVIGPLEHVHVDLFGPLPCPISVCPEGKVWVANMVDYFTKVAELAVVTTKSPEIIARAFYDNWVCRYGVPQVVTTDNGTEFLTHFKHLMKRLHITHLHTSVGHPQSNGAVERLNKTFKQMIKTHANDNPTNWITSLPHIRQGYMNRKHSVTGFSPNEMLFGFAPRLPVAVQDAVSVNMTYGPHQHVADVRDRKEYQYHKAMQAITLRHIQERQRRKRAAHRKRPQEQLQVGDLVLETAPPLGPLHSKTRGPFRIVALDATKRHATLITGGTPARAPETFQRHTSHLRKFRAPP